MHLFPFNALKLHVGIFQGFRIFNTWMGDPSKVVFLEEMVSVVKECDLLSNVINTGNMILDGFEALQVHCCILENIAWTLSFLALRLFELRSD